MTALLEVSDSDRGDLVLEAGGKVVLLGASGAGKTRWIRGLFGVREKEMGSVRLRGEKCSVKNLRKAVGWVPDNDGVFLDHTVWENVWRPPHTQPVSPTDAMDALELVALQERVQVQVGRLTHAERRRVALARAIARKAPILVVDGDVDATLKPLLLALLTQAPSIEGLVLTSAIADDTAWRADSVGLVHEGRVVAQAPWAELVLSNAPDVRGARLWVEGS